MGMDAEGGGRGEEREGDREGERERKSDEHQQENKLLPLIIKFSAAE